MTRRSEKRTPEGASKSSHSEKSASRSRPPRSTGPVKTSRARPKRPLADSAARQAGQPAPPRQDWRAESLETVRRLIFEADPDIIEERKWVKPSNPLGVPVWSRAGIICTGETYRAVVKLTFARGAAIADPQRLFNAGQTGAVRRAIDIHEGERLDAAAFKALVRAAVAANLAAGAAKSGRPATMSYSPAAARRSSRGAGAIRSVKEQRTAGKARPRSGRGASSGEPRGEPGAVRLLSGGNPQIAKGDGDAPVQAYIAAMPGWKSALGRRLDALIVNTVPNVRKAVRWNSPFYGDEQHGWFLAIHVMTRYVKVTFFAGKSLRPVPPGGTPKSKESRWIDIYEGDEFDEALLASWIGQAASRPGWKF